MRILLLTLSFLALFACSEEKTADHYLSEGKAYIEEPDFASAIIELQNALILDSSLGEARFLLGEIYLETGDILAAEHEFQRAQELDWNEGDVIQALAKTNLAQGKYEEVYALEHEDLEPASAAGLLSSQAMAALAEGDVEKSHELIALAQSEDPQSPEPKLAKATILLNQDAYGDALEEMEALLKVAPDNGTAWRIKGQALVRLERLEEARDALSQSIALSNFVFADRVIRAIINLQFEDYVAAQEDATELLKIAPDDPAANYIQGLLHFHNKDYLGAIIALNLAVPIAEQFPLTLYYLGLAYLLEKDPELSVRFAGMFVALSPETIIGRKLYAIGLVQTGKADEVPEALRPVFESDQNDIATLNISANAFLLDDQAYAGLVTYKEIFELNPDWAIVPLGRESEIVNWTTGDKVSQASEPGSDKDANFPQTEILLILEHLEKEDYPAAIEVAKSYQFRDLESISPYHVLGKVYLAAGELDNARTTFERALVRKPGDPFANQNLAQLAAQASDSGAAREYYQDILTHNPADLNALLQLASIEASEGNHGAMVIWLTRALKIHPNALEPGLVLARYYLATGEPDKVAPLFVDLDEAQSQLPKVLEYTGVAQFQLRQYSDALESFEQLVAVQPESAMLRYLLAMSASEVGDHQKSKAALLETIKIDANHVPALLSLAKMAHNEGEKEQFSQYLVKLNKLAPKSIDVLRLRALSEQGNGNSDEALELAQRAFTEGPTTQTALELISYQKVVGKNEEARTHMEDWIKQNPRDIAMRVALANHLESMDDTGAVRAQYSEVLQIDPENVVALNNLAWGLKDEDPEAALDYIGQASSLAPDNLAVLDSLAVIEYLNGNYTSAQANVQRALAGAPDDPSLRYHGAMIGAALGQTKQAIVVLEELTAGGADDFPERADAAKLLATLKSK